MTHAAKWLQLPLLCLVHVGQAELTGEEILKKVGSTFAAVRDYTVELNVTIDLDRLRVPSMRAKMYFKQPDKVHFESERFAMLPRESIALNADRLLSRYTVERYDETVEHNRRHYELSLFPKDDTRNLRRMVVVVDAERWVVTGVRSTTFDGRKMEAVFEHTRVDGYWLPGDLLVTFTSETAETPDPEALDQSPVPRRMSPPRNGTIKVRYTNYIVNSGLSDELFEARDRTSRK